MRSDVVGWRAEHPLRPGAGYLDLGKCHSRATREFAMNTTRSSGSLSERGRRLSCGRRWLSRLVAATRGPYTAPQMTAGASDAGGPAGTPPFWGVRKEFRCSSGFRGRGQRSVLNFWKTWPPSRAKAFWCDFRRNRTQCSTEFYFRLEAASCRSSFCSTARQSERSAADRPSAAPSLKYASIASSSRGAARCLFASRALLWGAPRCCARQVLGCSFLGVQDRQQLLTLDRDQ